MSERISDQGLASLIQSTAYQSPGEPASQAVSSTEPTGVVPGNDSPSGGAANEGQSPAAGNVPHPPVQETSQAGVTTQPGQGLAGQNPGVPDPRDIQLQQMTETIQNQVRYIQQASSQLEQVNQRQQEQAFEQSIADLPEEEQRAARAERKVRLLEEQQNHQQEMRNRQSQQQAKSMLAAMTAADYGLPISAQNILLGAGSYAHMQAMAGDLRAKGYGVASQQAPPAVQQQVTQAPPQQQQQQINPAHLGGDTTPSSDVHQKVEPGSGDLMALIQQTSWQPMSGE